MRRSDWAAKRIRSSPFMWEHGMGSPAIIAENALGLAADIEVWARQEFPGQKADELPDLIRQEVTELESALQTLQFLKEAPDAPSVDAAAYALGLTVMAQHEARKEAADVAIFAMRAILLLGGDPLEAIWEKWQEVRTRTYRKVQPETSADALPEQSGGNLDALREEVLKEAVDLMEKNRTVAPFGLHPLLQATKAYQDGMKARDATLRELESPLNYVICWGDSFLSDELDGGVGHWTKSYAHALAIRDFRQAWDTFERIIVVDGVDSVHLRDLPGAVLRGYTVGGLFIREVSR